MNKFKLTKNTKSHFGRTLYQIEALKDFGNIKKGDLGGWIETEFNLSQKRECWVFGDAMIYDNAKVSGDAKVSGNAWISGNAWVFGDIIKSKKDYITFMCGDYHATARKSGVQIGCCFKTFDEWLAIKKEDSNIDGFTMYYEYISFIQFAKEYFKRRK